MSKTLTASFAAVLLVGGNAWALRIVRPLEGSYEIPLPKVVMPASRAGTLIFTPCATCKTTSLDTTAATSYVIDKKPYTFARFLRKVTNIRKDGGDDSRTAVYIRYSVKNPHVTRLELARLGKRAGRWDSAAQMRRRGLLKGAMR